MTECSSGSKTVILHFYILNIYNDYIFRLFIRYLDYKCYNLLKRKFGNTDLSQTGFENLAVTKEKINIKHPNYPKQYEKYFKNIASYLQQGHVFMYADRRIPCSYINYLLNKSVREFDKHLSNPINGILKDFVKEYHISKGERAYADICASEIKRLDDNLYNKMKDLYELYSLYNELEGTHEININTKCNPYGNMIRIYNEAIKEHQLQDEELIQKLLILNKMTSEITLPDSKICYHRMSHFDEPKLYNDLKEQERREQERRQQEEQQQQQEPAAQNSFLAQVTQTTLGIPENNALSETPREVREESLNPAYPRRQEHSEEPHFGDPSTPLLGHLMEQKEEFYHPKVKYQASEDDQMIQSNTAGVLGSFQNTISGFIREVDPVPVVGVSEEEDTDMEFLLDSIEYIQDL
ncbi:hypothetical protein PVMG_06093 [Plasmodium vivax Mauritania I]|uniref:Uncharacterized protein n=1 Tax=Plasmodium vivax Mauritania I TaxID=1035515 RepID=A0A0J9THN9_PLAVI|nr:hypothetical protein PVMG_06093 [Plasmodium vivax Mauritania I]